MDFSLLFALSPIKRTEFIQDHCERVHFRKGKSGHFINCLGGLDYGEIRFILKKYPGHL